MNKCLIPLVVFVCISAPDFASEQAYADDYYAVAWHRLELSEADQEILNSEKTKVISVRIDQPGEVYTTEDKILHLKRNGIVVRVSTGVRPTGRITIHDADAKPKSLAFRVDTMAHIGLDHKKTFLIGKRDHYRKLANRRGPGTEWFRQIARSVNKVLGEPETKAKPNRIDRFRIDDSSMAIFSGSTAIDENLYLEQQLELRESGRGPRYELKTIDGITIEPFDWTGLIADSKTAIDPLAHFVPHDQHAIFSPSVSHFFGILDEAKSFFTPSLVMANLPASDDMIVPRYTRQLCFDMDHLNKKGALENIKSIAVTGSDPYFELGTDVAIVVETSDSKLLIESLTELQTDAARQRTDVEKISGKIDGTAFTGVESTDRLISAFVARLDENVVVLCNSRQTLMRTIHAGMGRISSLAKLDEYRFFRQRYPYGAETEAAFVMMTDAAIRRWCSPRWRIGQSRRIRAHAIMRNQQARFLDELIGEKAKPRKLAPEKSDLDLGELRLTSSGVVSSTFGSTGFMRPIIDIGIDWVTLQEMDAYARWKTSYERNWQWGFDPIGILLLNKGTEIGADVSVMPLRSNSRYGWLQLAANNKLELTGPLLDRSALWAAAIDGEDFAFELHAEHHPSFKEIFKMLADDGEVVMDDFKLPFIAIVRFSDTCSWWVDRPMSSEQIAGFASFLGDNLKVSGNEHLGKKYFTARGEFNYVWLGPFTICVYADEREVAIAMNEPMLRKYIEKRFGEAEDSKGAKNLNSERDHSRDLLTRASNGLLGKHAAARVSREGWDILAMADYMSFVDTQDLSFGNLPILNELMRHYPDRDPQALYSAFWHKRLVCPSGGEYRWNEEWQTFESTVAGHPHLPNPDPPLFPSLRTLEVEAGITVENNGLRTKVLVRRRE